MVQTIGPVWIIEGSLRKTVNLAVSEAPVGAKNFVVIVHTSGLQEVHDATIAGLPIRFDASLGIQELQGMISVEYEVVAEVVV